MTSRNGETTSSQEGKKSFIRTFLAQLNKRHLIETLAAFIGGGWLIIEFVDRILVAHYHFPDKTIDITFITLLCALLCTLLWRWFSGREKSRKFKLELVLIPLVVLIAVLLDINLLLHLKSPESETFPAANWKNSIAVLPFVDMSPQKDQDWFCDGITDEIIGRLSNISELKVPARTSVFYFKGKDQDIREIGNKLGVATVLEGSIQKVETRLRARVQLINIADGFHLWSEEFDREMKDVFAIQDEIALAVTDKLKLTLLGDEKAKLAKHQEIDPAAYEACLKGMYYWWQLSEEGMTSALGYFQKAIEIEPDYAPAHAGVALTYIYASAYFPILPPRDLMPKGIEAAQRAIQLDPMFADSYIARGYARMLYDWDWGGAGKDFKRALELNPHSSLALDAYANFLLFQRQFDEAVAVWTNASVSDPLSPMLHYELGWAFEMSGQFERAIPNFNRALELDQNFLSARLFLGYAYLFAGKTNEALEEFQIAKQWAPDDPWALGMLGWAYGITGQRAEAMQVQAELAQLSRKRYVLCYLQAYVCMGLGQKSGALDWLEKACEERDSNMTTLNVDRVFDPIRNEPRVQAILKKVGLIKPVKE